MCLFSVLRITFLNYQLVYVMFYWRKIKILKNENHVPVCFVIHTVSIAIVIVSWQSSCFNFKLKAYSFSFWKFLESNSNLYLITILIFLDELLKHQLAAENASYLLISYHTPCYKFLIEANNNRKKMDLNLNYLNFKSKTVKLRQYPYLVL